MNIHSRLISAIAVAITAGVLVSHGVWELSVASKPTSSIGALLELFVAVVLAAWSWYQLRHTQHALPTTRVSLLTLPAPRLGFAWINVKAHTQLDENPCYHAMILDSMADAVFIIDHGFRILDCNRAAEALLGRDNAELKGIALNQLLRAQQVDTLLKAIDTTVTHTGRWQGELCFGNSQGILTEAIFVPLMDSSTKRQGTLLGVVRDIRERKAAETHLGYAANYDPLTALPNRSLFRDRLDQVLADASWQRRQIALHLIDLDNFKLINEGLGHAQGDQVLQRIAQRLGAAVHRSDTLARVGGDKFALIQTSLHRVEQSAFRAQHLLDVVEPTLTIAGERELNVTASIGIALYPENGLATEELTHNAELALSRAKLEGRNAYCFFVRGMEEEMRVRCALEHDLGQALTHDEFLFHYQPQVELTTGRVIGCEALIRWHHPKYGLLYPSRFISMAEESGAIIPLGEWSLREVCRQLKVWQREGLPIGHIAVNLSAVQFRYPEFASLVDQVLRDASVDPACLELEVTESLAMENPELAASLVAQLKRLGVKLAIDDFGAGYSSLGYLKRFPVQMLKIDRSLIDELATNGCDAAITIAVIELGHSLDMHVLAEGIETREQLDFLRRHHCDFGQGTSFAAAMPAGEFAACVRRFAVGDPL
ncbi:putative bifunctional diguanylate cyclase/phosphodiesterase [Nitrococcus mobilis]|uniref:cyclic-guanylate-specific phosphodiesterase n=1 Tax=Nitrococcus mobilis Nb-231 TaxID=314278 RepID=A4BNI1_9GAMM|nr:GGDEF domain-containing phosphodiesterase [Nitrococcus mobilis]EAR22780.1 putative signal transducer protein with histidine kinase domain [Nitrococcus mobilis Nb-231]